MSGIGGRMLNKDNYTNETLCTYGYLSMFFIDLFYNDLYDQAVRYHRQKRVSTITDGYKCVLDAFLQNINKHDSDLYKNLVSGIYQTYLNHGFTGLSYNNCIDKVVKEFIPQDYWQISSFEDKSRVLGTVITNSTKKMIYKIVSNYLHDVIDNHDDRENTDLWQDEFVDILIMEREELYQSIIDAKINGGNDEHVLTNAMKKEIKLLYEEKTKLQSNIVELKKKNLDLKKIILRKHKGLQSLSIKYDKLQSEYDKLQSEHDMVQEFNKQKTDISNETSYVTKNPTKAAMIDMDTKVYMADTGTKVDTVDMDAKDDMNTKVDMADMVDIIDMSDDIELDDIENNILTDSAEIYKSDDELFQLEQ